MKPNLYLSTLPNGLTYEDLYEELGREPTTVEMQRKQSGLTEDLWEQFNMGKGVEEQ